MKPLLLFSSCLLLAFSSCQAQNDKTMTTINTNTISSFDIDRYLGTWYEIARYPHRFEKDLQGVTATYSYRQDGKIKVLNQGYKGSLNGQKSVAEGKAKLNLKDGTGKLKVSFFLFFYADYFILELDPNYQWALIGSSSPNYLWILSRTPQLPDETYQKILNIASDRGYDLNKLLKVSQPGE